MIKRTLKGATLAAFAVGTLLGSVATGIGATVLGSGVFSDVPAGSYFDKAVGEMYGDGVIKGNPDGSFRPADFVSRADVAVMFQRFKDSLDGTEVATRSSSKSSSSSSSSSSSVSSAYNPKGTMRFTTGSFSVNENIANATISVVRTGGNEGSVTINYAVTAGSATAGTDFEVVSGTLSFGAKETSKTFNVKILDDATSEGNETATITLSSPGNGVGLGTPSTATLTIVDNESTGSSASSASSSVSSNPNGTLSFSALTYGVNENLGTITVTVVRQGGTTGTVGVNYATSNNTATSGTDYTTSNGTLSFGAGETSKTFTIAIIDDNAVDGAKMFNLTLATPTGGVNLNTSAATVTIYDNDSDTVYGSGSLKLTKTSHAVQESDKKVDIVVQRTTGTRGTITVEYQTLNGSAISGQDFTYTSGTLVFAPGEASKIVTIPIVDDANSEGDDDFTFSISNPTSGINILTPSSALITISD